jgi:hypothetical protein
MFPGRFSCENPSKSPSLTRLIFPLNDDQGRDDFVRVSKACAVGTPYFTTRRSLKMEPRWRWLGRNPCTARSMLIPLVETHRQSITGRAPTQSFVEAMSAWGRDSLRANFPDRPVLSRKQTWMCIAATALLPTSRVPVSARYRFVKSQQERNNHELPPSHTALRTHGSRSRPVRGLRQRQS